MNPGRNDPCPCGSGKKFKKCCGAIISIAPQPAAPRQAARSCGTCTACCDGWMTGTIHGHEMKPGVPCHFVKEGGCTIYATRPQSPCRSFVCGYALPDSPFPEEFIPNRLGVIIVPISWKDRPAYILKAAGRDPDQALLEWMQRYSLRTGHPFFFEQNGEKLGFGPPDFQRDMSLRAQRGEAMW